MADIFISYASEDRARVRPLVVALAAHGWTVFWDQTVPPGLTWRGYIGKALEDSRSVVVVWSETSVGKEFVLEEAGDGKARGVLVPARIDDIVLPFGFRETQAANLIGWEDDLEGLELHRLVQSLERILGTPAPGRPPENVSPPAKPDSGVPPSTDAEEPTSAGRSLYARSGWSPVPVDVLVDYHSDDHSVAKEVVTALEWAGYSVFWVGGDVELQANTKEANFALDTQQQASRCVVALWSRSAAGSKELTTRARKAFDNRKLVSVQVYDETFFSPDIYLNPTVFLKVDPFLPRTSERHSELIDEVERKLKVGKVSECR